MRISLPFEHQTERIIHFRHSALEITKATAYNADIIIMDEPTSAISDKDVKVLFEKINALRDQGKSVIYISHKLDEIFQIADEITVLRDGRVIDSRPVGELDKTQSSP